MYHPLVSEHFRSDRPAPAECQCKYFGPFTISAGSCNEPAVYLYRTFQDQKCHAFQMCPQTEREVHSVEATASKAACPFLSRAWREGQIMSPDRWTSAITVCGSSSSLMALNVITRN